MNRTDWFGAIIATIRWIADHFDLGWKRIGFKIPLHKRGKTVKVRIKSLFNESTEDGNGYKSDET